MLSSSFLAIGCIVLVVAIIVTMIPVIMSDTRWHTICLIFNASCTLYAIGLTMIFTWIASFMINGI